MAHEIETMAYINATPWHGLGNALSPHQSIDVWQREAGMDWQIRETDVLFNVSDEGGLHVKTNPDAKVLYRSDTLAPLSVVSKRYNVVQPHDVLEFYRDLVSVGGFELETAGVLKSGRKLWALAKTGQEALLKGGDVVKAYLLLATSCDGSLATTAQFTSIRVVCNNTLQVAVAHPGGAVKVPHSTQFDPALVKQSLGIGLSAWDSFMDDVHRLAARPVNPIEAQRFLVEVLGDTKLAIDQQPNQRGIQTVRNLFEGQGRGSELASAQGTAWGLVNSVTEFVDHHRKARNQDFRLDSAWFGQGAALKDRAFQAALRLAA